MTMPPPISGYTASANTAGVAGSRRSRFAGTGSASKPGQDSTHFGSAQTPPGGAEQPGFFKTAGAFFEYWKNGENREALKAMMFKYGPDLANLAFCTTPIGWVAGILASPLSFISSKYGNAKMEKLKEDGKGHIFIHVDNIITEWKTATTNDSTKRLSEADIKERIRASSAKIKEEFNLLVNAVFTDPNPDSSTSKLRERLKMNENSNRLNWLKKFLATRLSYAQSRFGKVLGPLRWLGSKIPIRFVRFFFMLPDYGMMGLYALFNRGYITKLAGKLIRKI